MAKRRDTILLKKALLLFLVLCSALCQMGFPEQISDLSSTVCKEMSERHICVWTGCFPSEWTPSSHGCGRGLIFCGNSSSCPGGWQYKCCDISAELTVLLSGTTNLSGKRASSTFLSSSWVGELTLLKRLITNKKFLPRSPKEIIKVEQQQQHESGISFSTNSENSMGNEVLNSKSDMECDN